MGMEARDVIDIVTMFDQEDIAVWVEGGWGIDALLGMQNRDHGDLDLVVDSARADDARALLRTVGFEVIFDDAPGRYSFQDGKDRHVDLCFVATDRYGDRWNINRATGRGEPDYPSDGFTYGWIGGKQVPCIGPETQMNNHLGYETEEIDKWDAALLRERFDIPLPEALR